MDLSQVQALAFDTGGTRRSGFRAALARRHCEQGPEAPAALTTAEGGHELGADGFRDLDEAPGARRPSRVASAVVASKPTTQRRSTGSGREGDHIAFWFTRFDSSAALSRRSL